MNVAHLSLDQTPPLSVPAPYLLAAPWFAVTAGIWLAVAPEGFANRWFPAVLGATHLLTLGFLGLVMAGAIQQLLPVLLGAPLPRPRAVSAAVFLPLATGTVLLAAGLATSQAPLLHGAMGLLALALAGFLLVAGPVLWRATAIAGTSFAMRAAFAALAVTVGLGLHLAAGHAGAGVARGLTDVHVAWGLAGWIGLLVMGVAYQVVPMFQITPDYPGVLVRWLGPVLFAGLVLWSLARGVLPALAWIPALALAVFAASTLYVQHRRRRRLPDVTVAFWRLGMCSLLAAVLLWAAPWPGVELLTGVLFLVGFAMSVVSGMLYKIVPFLVWLHLNNQLRDYPALRGRIPPMKHIIDERAARWQFRLHLLAVVLLCVATLWPAAARPAGMTLAVAAAALGFNLAGALWRYHRIRRAAQAAPADDGLQGPPPKG
ncbi:MAG: hypothetical protein AB7U81_09815 [Thiohalomonadaceae bacterium]